MRQRRRILLTVFALIAAAIGLLFTACNTRKNVNITLSTYDGNTLTVTGERGTSVEFPDVEREGYLFDGWYVSADFSGQPIGSAVFESDVTYYAKWSRAYAVRLDLDGGTLAEGLSSTVWLREGESVGAALEGYVPVRGQAQFGGWYEGGAPLAEGRTMGTQEIALTAKYTAPYTVNAYLINTDGVTYTYHEGYARGYAVIGESFTPDIGEDGLIASPAEGDVTQLVISESAANVFTIHYTRAQYTLTLLSGSDAVGTVNALYGIPVDLPVPDEAPENCRFAGWALSADADVTQTVESKGYLPTASGSLYAVWNRGYTDVFGGYDVIYLNRDNSAVLSRGGIDIAGSYDASSQSYTFVSETGGITLRAVLNENYTFALQSSRLSGTYYLYDATEGAVSSEVYLTLTETDRMYYVDASSMRAGRYRINDEGVYIAELSGGDQFAFLLGTYGTSTVFRKRGEEYARGTLCYMGGGYPHVTLDGFGSAAVLFAEGGSVTYYDYAVNGDIFLLTDEDDSELGPFRILQYGQDYGYVSYQKLLDATFPEYDEDGNATGATLILDGCYNAVYTPAGGTTQTGTFDYVNSPMGGYIVYVTLGQQQLRFVTMNYGVTGYIRCLQLDAQYTEYVYCTPEGKVPGNIVFVTYSDGTAALYEYREASGVFYKVSEGTLEEAEGYYFLYTVTVPETADDGDKDGNGILDWASIQHKVMLVGLDSSLFALYGINGFYVAAAPYNDAAEEDYRTTYRGTEGGKLILSSLFAVYIDAEGAVYSCTDMSGDTVNYLVLADEEGNYHYFKLNESEQTFEVLEREPLTLYGSTDGAIDASQKLSVTGRELAEGQMEAILSVTADGVETKYSGYYTAKTVATLGAETEVYTFTATDGSVTFKFTVWARGTAYVFERSEADAELVLGVYPLLDGYGNVDENCYISATDTPAGSGYHVIYTKDGVSVRGTYTADSVTAFEMYTATVYTFTPAVGEDGKSFKFTLVSGYMRICEEEATYTSQEEGTLVLNGATMIGRYTDGAGNVYDGVYVLTDAAFDRGDGAVRLVIGSNAVDFDLDSTDNTFTVRGSEAGTYVLIRNGELQLAAIELNGYGAARVTLTSGEENEISFTGSYTCADDGTVTVRYKNADREVVLYTGRLASGTMYGTSINAFVLQETDLAGAYVDADDLSVLVLDDVGNVTKYDSYGARSSGSYVILEEGLFYYASGDGSEAAMYCVTGGTVAAASHAQTYYADDFASLVFYEDGVVLIYGAQYAYFTFDAQAGSYTFYTASDTADANQYGYEKKTYGLSDASLTYGGIRYTRFSGAQLTLTNGDATLVFTPDGSAAFTVSATYTPAEGSAQACYVVLSYSDAGAAQMRLVRYEEHPFSGSSYDFAFSVARDVAPSFTGRTFTLSDEEPCRITAYDYRYLSYMLAYGSEYAAYYYSQYYAYLVVTADFAATPSYSLSGGFAYATGTDGAMLTFTGGTVSAAGYYNSTYGHLYACTFTGSDEAVYDMTFYLPRDSVSGAYALYVYSLTRRGEALWTGTDGTALYHETFVYSFFNLTKDVDEGGNVLYYEAGDEYVPALLFRGELVCSNYFDGEKEGDWIIVSYSYNGETHEEYEYHFLFTRDDSGAVAQGSVERRVSAYCLTAASNGIGVSFMYNADSGEICEVYGLVSGGSAYLVERCEASEENTFTVTLEGGSVYTVTFTQAQAAAEDGTTVTIGETVYTVTCTLVESAQEETQDAA